MTVDSYRRQVAQHREAISKLQNERSKVAAKIATAQKKALDASIAAQRSTIASTVNSKLREVQRYASDEAKAHEEVRKIEVKISSETQKLVAAQKRLGQEEDKVSKKNIAEQKKRQAEQSKLLAIQQKAAQNTEHRLKSLDLGLAQQRYISQESMREIERLKALPEKICVAFFASDPSAATESRLALDEEVRSVQIKIQSSQHRDAVKLESRWAMRSSDILQAINELKPTVVHFSGHGTDSDELVLQDDNGNAKFISRRSIVQAIATFSSRVKLVFFNTCFSHNQASDCVEFVDAAIGMSTTIGDEAARVFSSQFYSAIGFGCSIPEAFQQAKVALMLEGIDEDSTPNLYLREGVDLEDLTLVKPPSI